jgi:hypothetical protein
MLCDALTQLPSSLVFNEPNLAQHRMIVRRREAEILAEVGVDLHAFARRWSGLRRWWVLSAFARELLPRLEGVVAQVGVKEIFNTHWRRYQRQFPDLRILLTARDPRDIFLSLQRRHASGLAIWSGPFTPERVAQSLNREFRAQLEMQTSAPCLRVRYEDLCQDPARFEEIKAFVGNETLTMGSIGRFQASEPRRAGEHEVHRGSITDRQVGRWRRETDAGLRQEAQQVFDRMPEYCDFWGYEP